MKLKPLLLTILFAALLATTHAEDLPLIEDPDDPTKTLSAEASGAMFYELGMEALEEGNYDGAGFALVGATMYQPENPTYLSAYANLLARVGDVESAEEFYAKAVALQPEDADVWFSRGINLTSANRLAEAEPCYRKAAELAPDDASHHGALGQLCLETKRFEEAVGYLERSMESDGSVIALRCLCLAMALSGDWETAFSHANFILDQDGLEPTGRALLTLLHEMKGNEAERDAERAKLFALVKNGADEEMADENRYLRDYFFHGGLRIEASECFGPGEGWTFESREQWPRVLEFMVSDLATPERYDALISPVYDPETKKPGFALNIGFPEGIHHDLIWKDTGKPPSYEIARAAVLLAIEAREKRKETAALPAMAE